jgi:hypothetical protein
MQAERLVRSTRKSRSTPKTEALSRFGLSLTNCGPYLFAIYSGLHRSSSTIASLLLKTGQRTKGRTPSSSGPTLVACVYYQSSPSIEVKRAPSSRKGGQDDEYQSEDHDFGRIAEDQAGQLLRRTGACGCQCVLCPGRRHEIERRDRVWMLVASIGGASYHSEVLRVIAVGGLIVTKGAVGPEHNGSIDRYTFRKT